jgi:hypothetical protein
MSFKVPGAGGFRFRENLFDAIIGCHIPSFGKHLPAPSQRRPVRQGLLMLPAGAPCALRLAPCALRLAPCLLALCASPRPGPLTSGSVDQWWKALPRRSRGQIQATRGANGPSQGQLACPVLSLVCVLKHPWLPTGVLHCPGHLRWAPEWRRQQWWVTLDGCGGREWGDSGRRRAGWRWWCCLGI